MTTKESMKKDIEILEKIQGVDSEIYQCREVINEVPEEIKALEASAESERKTLKALEEDLRSTQLKQKQKEADLADKEAAIKKHEGQLAALKTNKEYSVMQAEIAAIKADNSILEEAIIGLFDQVEACQGKLKEEQVKVAQVEKELAQKKALLEQKADTAKKRVEELRQSKKSMIKEVNPELASLYEKIVEKKRGLALVKIDGEVCAACQMQLRPQVLNEIQLGDKVVICEQCSRILYSE